MIKLTKLLLYVRAKVNSSLSLLFRIHFRYLVVCSTYFPFKYVAPNAFLAFGRGGKFDSNRPHFGEYVSTVVKLVSNKPSASPPRITLTSK